MHFWSITIVFCSNILEYNQGNGGRGRGAKSQMSKEKSELSGSKVGDYVKQTVIVPSKNVYVRRGTSSSQYDSEVDLIDLENVH